MRNIFKTFKENKNLLEENKLLEAQNKSLSEFKHSFDAYYRDISGVRVITKNYDKTITLKGVVSLDPNRMNFPIDVYKEEIVNKIAQQCFPFVEFDVGDNAAYGTKGLIGKLVILTK